MGNSSKQFKELITTTDSCRSSYLECSMALMSNQLMERVFTYESLLIVTTSVVHVQIILLNCHYLSLPITE